MTMVITRDEQPLTVWLDWMASDNVVYGIVAYTCQGAAVTLDQYEENEALELVYGQIPAESY